jgi:hypothetical protein
MWSDNEASVDLLGFQHLVSGVLTIVKNDALLPATIGVFGDWGSGKSSLLQIVADELRRDQDILVLTFNGWLFEDYGDARAALMGTILDALAEDLTLTPQAKRLMVKLTKRVNWWRVLGSAAKGSAAFALAGPAGLALAAGPELATAARDLFKQGVELKDEDLAKYLAENPEREERRSISEFREDFGKLLAQTKRKRLVVIIDDLDRCLPDTIIATLEAIKLFLFVKNTAFVVGADERLVKYAVRRKFPELPGERADVGRDYLEKLIQFPIRVPPLGRGETETYIGLLYAERAGLDSETLGQIRRAAVECDPTTVGARRFMQDVVAKALTPVPPMFAEELTLAERLAPILAAETLGNPRQCKRFLNMLSIRLGMAKSRAVADLQPRVFAKLMLLEYYRSESFRQLAAAQAEEMGRPAALAKAERQAAGQPAPASTPAAPSASPTPPPAPTGRRITPTAPPATAPTDDGETIDGDTPLWLLDAWVVKWLKIEPPLAGIDLRPYFYFSRDLLGPLASPGQRMSPSAQDAYARLTSGSDAERQLGVRAAASMSPADASAVFEALAQRIREDDALSADTAALVGIVEWVKARPELTGQLAALFSSLPAGRVPLALPLKLVTLGTSASGDPIRKLFSQWSQSSVTTLKNSAAGALRRVRA